MNYKISMNFVKNLKFLGIFEVIVKKTQTNYKIQSKNLRYTT
jgi:hypothetical protein